MAISRRPSRSEVFAVIETANRRYCGDHPISVAQMDGIRTNACVSSVPALPVRAAFR